MALAGWRLDNYPERLSYSATPPDFGSLVVQRRRWANGGLIILPKLITLMRQQSRDGVRGRVMESFLRLNYLASITWATFGLMLLLAYPFDDRLLSPLVVAAAVLADEGQEFDEADLRERLRTELSAYKIPRRFIVLTELPLMSSGKVDVRRLVGLFDA